MLQDLTYTLRTWRNAPAVTAAALVALALGIGANTAIFSLMDAVVLRPLPYPQPDRLMMVHATTGKNHRANNASWPMAQDWREQNRVFEHLAAFNRGSANLTGAGDPWQVNTAHVTTDFFPVLGVSPAVGGELPGNGHSAVVTWSLWQRCFSGDRAAIGRALILDGKAYTLAGVLPKSFRFPKRGIMEEPDLYLPLEPNPNRRTHYLEGIGRLKAGVTVAQAQTDLDVISRAIEQAHAPQNRGEGAKVTSLHESMVGETHGTFVMFLGAVAFVLLIACANVSNLLLSQAVRRRREVAIRAALGATRGRLIRQFLAESALLSLCGGGLGLLLALWAVPMLTAIAPANTPFGHRLADAGIQLNWLVMAFTAGLSLAAGALFGTLPAWFASRPGALQSRSMKGDRLRGLLIAGEVALSLVLLCGAGLMVRSFQRLLAVDPGFQTQNLLTIDVELPDSKYAQPEGKAGFARAVLARLERLPGVTAAAAVTAMPLSKASANNGFSQPGGDEIGLAGFRAVSPGYFHAMGIPLIRGRLPAPGEEHSMVINQAMAARYWPAEDAIGKVIETPRVVRVATPQGWDLGFQEEQFRIVGIVGNVLHLSLDDTPHPEMFLPFSLMATSDFTFLLRSPTDVTRAARREIWAVDPDQPVAAVRSMDQLISADVRSRRFVLLLLALFAAVAMALAAAGIFAVVHHSVAQRTREIGIRMALGADAAAVVRLVLRQSLVWTAGGLILGAGGSLASGRLLGSYLFAVKPRDPATLAAAVLLLGLASAGAAWIPARGASRVDPAATLRGD